MHWVRTTAWSLLLVASAGAALASATCCIFVSAAGTAEVGEFRLMGARHRLRADRSGFRWLAPPLGRNRAVRDWTRRLDNRSAAWVVHARGIRVPEKKIDALTVHLDSELLLEPFPSSIVSEPDGADTLVAELLLALEDRSRFVGAHVALERFRNQQRVRRGEGQLRGAWTEPRASGADHVVGRYGDLRVVLRPPLRWREYGPAGLILDYARHELRGEPAVVADPAQVQLLRRYWHDQFDVQWFALPYWSVISVSLIPPGIVAWRVARRRDRLRRGLCVGCGYDLRHSPERCPECGRPAPRAGGTSEMPRSS